MHAKKDTKQKQYIEEMIFLNNKTAEHVFVYKVTDQIIEKRYAEVYDFASPELKVIEKVETGS